MTVDELIRQLIKIKEIYSDGGKFKVLKSEIDEILEDGYCKTYKELDCVIVGDGIKKQVVIINEN